LGALLALAGCAAGYRDASAPVSSLAVFEPVRFAGTWIEVARYPVAFEADCLSVAADYRLGPEGRFAVERRCRTAGGERVTAGTARPAGPGRLKLRLDGVRGEIDWWVLWADADYRTAVIGAPSGRMGWILNRDPAIPADRLRAARAVLAFNGYDPGRLEMSGGPG